MHYCKLIIYLALIWALACDQAAPQTCYNNCLACHNQQFNYCIKCIDGYYAIYNQDSKLYSCRSCEQHFCSRYAGLQAWPPLPLCDQLLWLRSPKNI